MDWIIEAGIALSMVALTGGLMAFLVISTAFRKIKEIEAQKSDLTKLKDRLKELEQRVTDMQDVVLSVDEKLAHTGAPSGGFHDR